MESRPYSWVALDPDCDHPREIKEEKKCDGCCNLKGFGFNDNNAFIDQDSIQAHLNRQISEEMIVIRDSCDVNVQSVDQQAISSVFVAINALVVVAITATIADEALAELVAQDVLQLTESKQLNRQKILIDNSRCVNVTTLDQDAATLVSILINALVAIFVAVNIL
ncbi:spore coat protein [Bacillus subtilis]|uniref:spore coat protein n=1 Tax=Bacillus subtilis TaxID=1423 RepID=UPI00209AEC5F|nr:spore coat protein [Bacillus subtilis]MCO8147552.1 spore coat protein [Bacillus subtilis]MDQ4708535.1 spore coat protein [Bacillus subtilis]MEC2178681.1 spore coat protein [Bacillus subtilis]